MNTNEVNLTPQMIADLGLTLSKEKINATISPGARVFTYPGLHNVFVMESDLYGNRMPAHSCFLAFEGRNGLIGKHITVNKLTVATVDEIRKLVESNTQG